MKANIHEVLSYGPIVASSEELGLLVTINGAYLNLWVTRDGSHWENTDCRAREQDLYQTSCATAKDEGEAYIEDVLNEASEQIERDEQDESDSDE